MWEKSLPNKQVTFLVYREGDQLNFFRVVDRGDGTLTPVSESLRSVQRRENTCQEEQFRSHCTLVPFFRQKQMFQNYSFHVSCCFTNEDMHQHLLANLTVCNICIISITKSEKKKYFHKLCKSQIICLWHDITIKNTNTLITLLNVILNLKMNMHLNGIPKIILK